MTMTRFPTLLVLPATLWLAVSLGDNSQHHSSGSSEGALVSRTQRRMLQLLRRQRR